MELGGKKYSKLEEESKSFFSASTFSTLYIYIYIIYKYITAQNTDSSPSLDPAVSPLKRLPWQQFVCNLFTSRSLSFQ